MSREQILDFQARLMRPAGIAAIAAAVLLIASGIVGSVGSAEDTAEQLDLYQDHAGRYELAGVLSGLGLLLLSFPLYFLFRSARARAERMRSFLGPLIVFGAVLVAIQGTLIAFALKSASDDFVAGVPAVEAKARQQAAAQPQPTPDTGGKEKATGKGAPTTTAATTTSGTTTSGTTTTAAKTPEERVDDARDDFAEDTVNDSSLFRTGRLLGLFGGLALIGGAVYTLVWAMRTGLLTRFMATLGMVFIAALVVIPAFGPVGLILWFAVLGLMLAGFWPRPLPPAWEAGEAIPWPKPGEAPEEPGEGPPGTVEGSGREISEPPLPEDGVSDQPPEPPYGETQGQRRKKRKRRK